MEHTNQSRHVPSCSAGKASRTDTAEQNVKRRLRQGGYRLQHMPPCQGPPGSPHTDNIAAGGGIGVSLTGTPKEIANAWLVANAAHVPQAVVTVMEDCTIIALAMYVQQNSTLTLVQLADVFPWLSLVGTACSPSTPKMYFTDSTRSEEPTKGTSIYPSPQIDISLTHYGDYPSFWSTNGTSPSKDLQSYWKHPTQE